MECNKLNSWSWTREKVIIVGCTMFFILSVIDGALTLRGLGLGAIEEVNPIMQWVITQSPIAFMAVKLSLPVILGLILCKIRNRSRKFIAYSLGFVLIVYSVVMGLHVYWLVCYDLK